VANDNESKKVIICGAGIGGLTAAHELAKRGFDVVVYERNKILGGLARSAYLNDNDHEYPIEYSWRVYGTHYKNLLRLLAEIPLAEDETKTVYDNLVLINRYIFPREDDEAFILPREKGQKRLLKAFTTKDKFQILNKILFCVTMSTDRMDSMDNLKWKDYCADLSDEAKKYLIKIWGPVLGMDPSFMSFPVVARMMKVLLGGFADTASGLYLMNQPTNDGWFDNWEKHLESSGHVTIKKNHEIKNIELRDGKIQSVTVLDKETDETLTDTADYFVCSLPAESIAKIVKENTDLSSVLELSNTIPLAKASRQVQMSVQVFLDQKLIYPTPHKNVLYLPDTPWALIIEPEALAWDATYSTDSKVKSVHSVGACQTDVPGIVHGKPFTACNEQEVEDEVMEQMIRSYQYSGITTQDGKPFNKDNVVLFYIWHSFTFDEQAQRMDTWEPKFSNNANSLKYQPTHNTSISNLLFATGYTKTDRYIYSMEAATEAGLLCANEIIKQSPLKKFQTNVLPFHASPHFFRPLAALDRVLFKLRLPHLSKLLLGSSTLLTFLYVTALTAITILLITKIF
jgi:uncharacterized protein with NAD-binding domain and iron-sulfur cluster